jgi:hypothetical protein
MENKKIKNSLLIHIYKTLTHPPGKGELYHTFSESMGARQIVHLHGLKTALLNTLVYGCCPACASPQVKKIKAGVKK